MHFSRIKPLNKKKNYYERLNAFSSCIFFLHFLFWFYIHVDGFTTVFGADGMAAGVGLHAVANGGACS
jgi:hypothetical protein